MSLLNSVSDLQPLAIKALENKEWHCFADVLREIGHGIMPERAVRFYQGQGGGDRAAAKDGGDPRPLDERIRAGRRRGVYLILRSMMKRKMVECKDEMCDPDDREYRLVSETPMLKRGGSKPRPKAQATGACPSGIVGRIEELQCYFADAFPGSRDHGDFKFHCRHLKRIALLQAPMAAPQPHVEEPAQLIPPAKES